MPVLNSCSQTAGCHWCLDLSSGVNWFTNEFHAVERRPILTEHAELLSFDIDPNLFDFLDSGAMQGTKLDCTFGMGMTLHYRRLLIVSIVFPIVVIGLLALFFPSLIQARSSSTFGQLRANIKSLDMQAEMIEMANDDETLTRFGYAVLIRTPLHDRFGGSRISERERQACHQAQHRPPRWCSVPRRNAMLVPPCL